MLNVLVPIDGSADSLGAVKYVIRYGELHRETMHVFLVNIQPLLSKYITRFATCNTIDGYRRERAEQVLQPAIDLLDKANVPCTIFIRTGSKARNIVACAEQARCHKIVMGTARKSSLVRFVEGSVTNSVIALAAVPVEVVAGRPASRLERFCIPAGLGAALALLLLATD